jgi:sporulation protein YlmC with PRC-barrel domain
MAERRGVFRLAETTLIDISPTDDLRGRRVIDSAGREIGTVSDLIVDEHEELVRFFEVHWARGVNRENGDTLIPIDTVNHVTDQEVHVNLSEDKVCTAPLCDPDLREAYDLERLCEYFNCTPYWAPEYMYPDIPHSA